VGQATGGDAPKVESEAAPYAEDDRSWGMRDAPQPVEHDDLGVMALEPWGSSQTRLECRDSENALHRGTDRRTGTVAPLLLMLPSPEPLAIPCSVGESLSPSWSYRVMTTYERLVEVNVITSLLTPAASPDMCLKSSRTNT
jgi:hypothetical protein